MKRRIFSLTTILGVLLLVALLFSSHSASALTPTKTRTKTPGRTPTRTATTFIPSLTPTLTRTLTPTNSPTGPACVNPTPERLQVAKVTTPTSLNTQVIQVTLHNGVSVTVGTMTTQYVYATFTSTTKVGDVFNVTIDLTPNTTTYLTVTGTVGASGACASYNLVTQTASDGSDLTIVQMPQGNPTVVPTALPTQTPSPVCSPVTATIAAPFTWDGVGTFCWQSNNLGTYVNSFNMATVTVNGVNYTNLFGSAASFPAKINGYWYVYAVSIFPWGHFETK